MPAKVTLHNYAWAEDDSWCSHAEAWVDRLDDYLEPTRYFVKKFLSKSDVKGSSAKFGYTFISADSEIDVLKDIKEDVVVHERHEMRSHEEKSGLSFLGGVKVPDPTLALKRAEQAYRADNMMGFTTSAISAAAKGIRTYQDYKQVKKVMNTPGELNFAQTIELLKVLSHFVNGPSIQIGSRSIDVEQSQDISHGNLFTAPKMVFHNKERSTFAGKFVGDDIDIKTKTFVTFDLPQVFHSKMSMHQSGISVDLLTLALACCGGAGLMAAALTATTVNVSSQDNEQHVEVYEPTVIHANKLNIEAETGELTQAQIKAGIVHAIFTKDLSLKSLANIKWSKNSGGGIGFSLGGFANFASLADSLVKTAASSSRSHIDSGSFEKKIDDFASMVGEEEFYLKVGNVLKTESAFIGHILHDPKKEHIEAGKRIDTEVEQQKYSWDNSFDLSIKDLTDTIGAIKQTVFDNAIEEGATTEDAVKEVQKVEKETREFLEKEEVKETVKELKKINKKLKKVEEKQKKLEEETPELKTSMESKTESSERLRDGIKAAPELSTKAETIENRTHSLDEKKVEEYQQVLSEKNILAKKALDLGVSLKDSIDNFATDHGWNSSVKNVLIKGLQAIGIGAAIGAAAAVATEAGLVAGLTAGAGIFIAGEATAKVTDLSAEAAVTYAISQADTEEEAQSYADLVISMVEWGVIGLSAVGAYKGVKGKAPALRNTFSKAKISELFGLSRAKKAGVTASVSEASASVGMIEKTFTKAEMKELLASKANDNFSSINDNGICMSKGKVVNGESVGVGRVSSSVVNSSFSSSVKISSNNLKCANKKGGRSGKQARLKEIMEDDKVSSVWRGWLKQDANAMKRDSAARPGLRVPPGTQLAHERGFEAAKGYGYEKSNLQITELHKIQHKHDKQGRLNKDRGKK